MVTIASLQRISAPKLADMILEADAGPSSSKLAVVDVRDDDHIGGHIKDSLHIPYYALDAMMPTLLRKLDDKDTVIFHCSLSEQRGPGAALRYLREKEAKQTKAGDGEDEHEEQKVFVLDRGFVGWQEQYGEDERLTTGYRKEIWKDGYWM